MTGGEIEFLDGPDERDRPEQPFPALRDAPEHTLASAVAVGGWLVAAVLAALAPFDVYYRVVQPASGRTFALVSYSVDGWGRIVADDGPVGGTHGTRFGVASFVCAALLLMLAAVGVVQRNRRIGEAGVARLTRSVAVGSLAVTALFAGALGAVFLDLRAEYDRVTGNTRLSIGAFIWLSCAALVVAALATVAQFRAAQSASAERKSGQTG